MFTIISVTNLLFVFIQFSCVCSKMAFETIMVLVAMVTVALADSHEHHVHAPHGGPTKRKFTGYHSLSQQIQGYLLK